MAHPPLGAAERIPHHMQALAVTVALTVLIFLSACKEKQVKYVNDENVAPGVVEALESLDDVTVFFGHQSVGGNILDGIRDLGASAAVDVRIASLDSFESGATPAGAGAGEAADVALMKFCYTDSGHAMSAEDTFHGDIEEMERLEAEYPDTTLAYVTMPVMAPRPSQSNPIKNVLGMDLWGRKDSIEQERFKNLLREAKGETARLIDLAAWCPSISTEPPNHFDMGRKLPVDGSRLH